MSKPLCKSVFTLFKPVCEPETTPVHTRLQVRINPCPHPFACPYEPVFKPVCKSGPDRMQALPRWAVAGILALNALGYLIFRGSNSQKNAFRQNPDGPVGRRLRTLQTATGRRLIVSGWWGIARHINYFGDWLLGCVLLAPPIPQREVVPCASRGTHVV